MIHLNNTLVQSKDNQAKKYNNKSNKQKKRKSIKINNKK